MDPVVLRVDASPPDRAALDALLDGLDGRRLVIDAGLDGLVAVLSRLARRGELGRVETAVLPRSTVPFLTGLGITPDTAPALLDAPVRAVGVVKDDSGGLFVSSAGLRPWAGASVWARVYVDDQPLCDGEVREVTVERGGRDEVVVTARSRWRSHTARGRAVQLACGEAAVYSDGVRRERSRRKRLWYGEPDQWLLAVPDSGYPSKPPR